MKGLFKVYPIGKNVELSRKSKKNCYTFAEGIIKKDNGNGLLDKCVTFNFWSDEDLKLEFMQPINAILDRQVMGDSEMVSFVRIVNESMTMQQINKLLTE